jgi:hypothetical protein
VWQFNFKGFRLADDVYAQDSIELLKQSGIDFAQNEARGIEVQRFGELLMTSGIVLNEDIRWITFHRYDTKSAQSAQPACQQMFSCPGAARTIGCW